MPCHENVFTLRTSMDFAKKELEKYGWSEGEGLGKNKTGISKALKPKLKFDNAGLGHDLSDEFSNHWWERVYNEAASNICTKKNDKEVRIERKDEPIEISIRNRKKRKRRDDSISKYKGFVKTSELDNGMEKKVFKDADTASNVITQDDPGITNSELFKICGGRTVHKGARHGLKMSAKLARLEAQEKNMLKELGNSNKELDCSKNLSKKKLTHIK